MKIYRKIPIALLSVLIFIIGPVRTEACYSAADCLFSEGAVVAAALVVQATCEGLGVDPTPLQLAACDAAVVSFSVTSSYAIYVCTHICKKKEP